MRTDIAFWDTSAIIPLCVRQDATFEARRVGRLFSRRIIWCGTAVEFHSSISRLKRTGEIEAKGCSLALKQWFRFQRLVHEVRAIDALVSLAVEMPERYGLRSLDAFQLASALIWCNERPRNRPFVCADRRLATAASDAGFELFELL